MKTKPPVGDFRNILERISHRHDTRRVFDAFTRFAACALAAQTREAEYLEEVKRWQKPDMDLFAEAFGALVSEMESHPFEDIIGGHYMEFALSSKGQQWNGEYHTPKNVCVMVAKMMLRHGIIACRRPNHRLRTGVRRRGDDSVGGPGVSAGSPAAVAGDGD